MRNLHIHIRSEYGIENVKLFQWWENMECKMANFQNHRRFSLRCLKQDVIPISIRLKSNIKTPRGLCIVKRAEKIFAEWKNKSINNMISMLEIQRDICIKQLKTCLDERTMEECERFITIRRESRHISTLGRQLLKFESLCHKIRLEVAAQTIRKNKMATQTSRMNMVNNMVKKTNGS